MLIWINRRFRTRLCDWEMPIWSYIYFVHITHFKVCYPFNVLNYLLTKNYIYPGLWHLHVWWMRNKNPISKKERPHIYQPIYKNRIRCCYECLYMPFFENWWSKSPSLVNSFVLVATSIRWIVYKDQIHVVFFFCKSCLRISNVSRIKGLYGIKWRLVKSYLWLIFIVVFIYSNLMFRCNNMFSQ